MCFHPGIFLGQNHLPSEGDWGWLKVGEPWAVPPMRAQKGAPGRESGAPLSPFTSLPRRCWSLRAHEALGLAQGSPG